MTNLFSCAEVEYRWSRARPTDEIFV